MVAPVEAPAPALPTSSRFFGGALFPSPSYAFRRKRSTVAIPGVPRSAAPPPSPLPSLRPRTRRPNHLRPKLLKILSPSPPHPVPEAPQAPLEGGGGGGGGGEAGDALVEEDDPRKLELPLPSHSHDNPTDGYAFVVEERETALLLCHEVGDRSPLFPKVPDPRDVPRLLLELSVYLLGLLAVQTVCAVWLFGGIIAEEGKSAETAADATVGEVKGPGTKVGDSELEFELTVAAIQAMAREARVAEAREALEKDGVSGLRGDIMDEVNRRLERMTKKTPRVYLDAKALTNALVKRNSSKVRRTPEKGLNGSKASAASTRDLSNGGSQQIDRDGHFKIPSELHAAMKSNAHGSNVPEEETAGPRDPLVSDFKISQKSGDLNASDLVISEKSRNDHIIGNGGIRNNPVSQQPAEHKSSFEEVIHHKQTDISNRASGTSRTNEMGTPHSQSSLSDKHDPSSTYGNSYAKSKIVSDKKTENKHLHEKAEDSQTNALNQLWWLKLPYVLGIFLHRGSNRKEFKGLYSLKLESSSEEGNHSYTIVFEDRIDATNFCYLLELFFENLDDFSADIVPLSIQEVHDAVKSRTLKVIVVRKGQLQLYAGQPLAEAEMQLRSMLDSDLQAEMGV